jgi:hypothetical protein
MTLLVLIFLEQILFLEAELLTDELDLKIFFHLLAGEQQVAEINDFLLILKIFFEIFDDNNLNKEREKHKLILSQSKKKKKVSM